MLKAAAKNSAFRPSLPNPQLSDVMCPLAAASDFGNNPSVLTKFGNNGHASVGWAFLPSSHLSPSPSPLPSSPFYHNQTFTLAAVAGSGKAQVHRPFPCSLFSPSLCILMRPQRRARGIRQQRRRAAYRVCHNSDAYSYISLIETSAHVYYTHWSN